jgi:nucleoside-diphosphate-sugar epimerase
VLQLCSDKDIVYSTIGFTKYEAKYWGKTWPVVTENLLEGSSQKAGQKFVFCDNLYAYGSPGSMSSISPSSTLVNATLNSKPGVRSVLHNMLQDRMDQDPSHPVVVVAGSDFFGPNVTATSFFGNPFTRPIVEKGKTKPIIIGSSSLIHDFCYTKDFANALYLSSVSDKGDNKFWIAPHSVKNKTIQAIANDIGRLADSTNCKVTVYPGWIVRIGSVFDSFLKEMIEMLPIWTKDYKVDDSEFCTTFNVEPTPYEEALLEYIDFFKAVIAEEKIQQKTA